MLVVMAQVTEYIYIIRWSYWRATIYAWELASSKTQHLDYRFGY